MFILYLLLSLTIIFDRFNVNLTESLIQSNPKNITIECIKGGHMVPCENPDSISTYSIIHNMRGLIIFL